ncbi:MAG: N-acetylneuraminate synthase [Theionarchaea archaeon]|nr:N-acetylneuraminate synthase [Theionarchaea archaeon]
MSEILVNPKRSTKIKIGQNLVGDGEPCFIIAEAGVNHDGSLKQAKTLIEAAHKAGVDAVKFQTFTADALVTPQAEKATYQKNTAPGESHYTMLKRLELRTDDFEELAEYAEERKLIFLSSPFDTESVSFLDRLGVPAFKVASGEITNIPLLSCIARKGKPVILSTGMATMGEIEAVLPLFNTIPLILLHCVTQYPAPFDQVNLRVIQTLKKAFGYPVGFSDHTLGYTASLAAVALGACVIEKHFTIDKTLPGPDHGASLEPRELGEMVNAIRQVENALGNGIKAITSEEEKIRAVVRKSVVAIRDIPEGVPITEQMLAIKRPGTGLPPRFFQKVIGKRATRPIKAEEVITWEDIR